MNPNHQNFELFMRLWYVILLSHYSYFGVFIEVIWNYTQKYFAFVLLNNLFSNYVCLSAVLNIPKYEKLVTLIIIVCAYAASYSMKAFYLITYPVVDMNIADL